MPTVKGEHAVVHKLVECELLILTPAQGKLAWVQQQL